jgi:hypothetical protein
MGDIQSFIGNYTLYHITLPGTHDSLSFDSSSQIGNATNPLSATFGYMSSRNYFSNSFTQSVTESQSLTISIVNSLGQKAFEQNLGVVSGQRNISIDTDRFASGIYNVVLSNGFSNQNTMVIVK